MVKLRLKTSQKLVLRHLLKDLPVLNFEQGPWVAGGSVRSVAVAGDMSGVNDIDVFCRDEEQAVETRDELRALGFKRGHDTCGDCGVPTSKDAYWAFYKKGHPIVQLVVGWYHGTAEATIDGFSITACQFITDGQGIWAGDFSVYHVQQKWFWPVEASRIGVAFIHKYWDEYGYKHPGDKTKEEFLAIADDGRKS